jgi:hypothetical protein
VLVVLQIVDLYCGAGIAIFGAFVAFILGDLRVEN